MESDNESKILSDMKQTYESTKDSDIISNSTPNYNNYYIIAGIIITVIAIVTNIVDANVLITVRLSNKNIIIRVIIVTIIIMFINTMIVTAIVISILAIINIFATVIITAINIIIYGRNSITVIIII